MKIYEVKTNNGKQKFEFVYADNLKEATEKATELYGNAMVNGYITADGKYHRVNK